MENSEPNTEPAPSSSAPRPAAAPRAKHIMLYVHIPFCPSKCHFCGWVQGIQKRELLLAPQDDLRRAYIDALCREIRTRAPMVAEAGYTPNIVYWGGGTASSLSEAELEVVHAALAGSYDLGKVTEATIEGSPDTVTPAKLALMRKLGYGRISFGVQSMNDRRLRQIGRVHDADGARQAMAWAHDAGFEQINVDLMCGLPDEDLAEVERTVIDGVALAPTHVSYYPYRPIQDSVMRKQLSSGRGRIDARHQKAAYALGRQIIEGAGFAEYAMSYFGSPSLNDLAIFRVQQDWIGFGSGAHSLFGGVSRVHSRGEMLAYVADPLSWDTSAPAASSSIAMMLLGQGLSTFKGIHRDDWLDRTGRRLDQTMSEPALQGYFAWFRRRVGLVEDDVGIRLEREQMADAFIDMFLAMGR